MRKKKNNRIIKGKGSGFMKKRDLRHIHIYEDKKGQHILYNAKKKLGYKIPDGDVGKVAALQYRPYLVFAMGIVLYFLFNVNWWMSILAMGALFVLGEYTYRIGMLKKYSVITNYTPYNVLDKSIGAYKQNPRSMLIRVALYFSIGVLLIYSIKDASWALIETQILLVVAAFSFINGGYHVYILLTKKNK